MTNIESRWPRDFFRHLEHMTKAGLSFPQALGFLFEQESAESHRSCLERVLHSLESGQTLSGSLQKAEFLTPFEINMVAAGETSGSLMAVLSYLADYREKSSKLRQQILSALVYPAISLAGAVLLLIFLLPYLMEGQIKLLEETHSNLPALTELMLQLAWLLGSWPFWLMLLGFVYLVSWIPTVYRHDQELQLKFAQLLCRTPLASLYRDLGTSRFARPFALALAAGLVLNKNLRLASLASNNALLAAKLPSMEEDLVKGKTLTEVFEATEFFSPTFLALVRAGEESGRLEAMMWKLVEISEQETEHTLSRVTQLVEPLALVLMGLIVGLFVLGVLLPTLQVLEGLA